MTRSARRRDGATATTAVRTTPRPEAVAGIAGAVVITLTIGLLSLIVARPEPTILVGTPSAAAQAPTTGAVIVAAPEPEPEAAGVRATGANRGRPIGFLPEPRAQSGLRQPDAGPYGPAVAFDSDLPVPDHLLFVLVAGSDARPGEDMARARADSVHLVAVNPQSGTGTVLGFPRDAWVEIPGHGRGRINSALALGGPDLLSETVRRLTGLPVHYWVLTRFEGLVSMVDELGRVVIEVDRRMADRASGAFFDRGFHNMSGTEALAFSRNRKDTARGDFSRSENHGRVMLAALAKLRTEVGDMESLSRWVGVMWRHVRLDISFDDALYLGATARRLDPAAVGNVVVPGTVGRAGRASVVFLDDEAAAMFTDLRDDATLGVAPAPTTTSTSTTTTTTTTTTTAPTTTSTTTTTTSTTVTTEPAR